MVRTSLQRAPSAYTREQIIDRSRSQQSLAWSDGLLVVHRDDDRLTWDQREMVRMIGDKLSGAAIPG